MKMKKANVTEGKCGSYCYDDNVCSGLIADVMTFGFSSVVVHMVETSDGCVFTYMQRTTCWL